MERVRMQKYSAKMGGGGGGGGGGREESCRQGM